MQQASARSLRREFLNPLARMLPLSREQAQVYRLAEKLPPGLEGYQPRWEVVNAVLGAQKTLLAKIDLMTDFYLLAVLASSTLNTVGGFRVQLYDTMKKRALQDRGLQFSVWGGALGPAGPVGPFFLREPYHFDIPRSQVQLILQNLEPNPNTVQIVLYGQAAPFEGALSNEPNCM
jgi:hypothetical protein